MARLPYQPPETVAEAYPQYFESPGDVLNIHRLFANAPDIFDPWGEWSAALYEAMPDVRTRELTILAAARAVDGEYIWQQHVPMALDGGMSREEVIAIGDGTHDGFDDAERALLDYASTAVQGTVTETLHERMASHYDAQLQVTLLALASEYLRVATMMEALALDIEEPFVGWGLENE